MYMYRIIKLYALQCYMPIYLSKTEKWTFKTQILENTDTRKQTLVTTDTRKQQQKKETKSKTSRRKKKIHDGIGITKNRKQQ